MNKLLKVARKIELNKLFQLKINSKYDPDINQQNPLFNDKPS